jgi:hypothetical protein
MALGIQVTSLSMFRSSYFEINNFLLSLLNSPKFTSWYFQSLYKTGKQSVFCIIMTYLSKFEIRFVEERLHVSPWLSSRITWDWRGKLKSLSRHSIFSIFQDKQWIRLKKCREWCKLTFICSLLKGVKRLHTKALRARVNKRQQINKREQTSEKYRIEPTK